LAKSARQTCRHQQQTTQHLHFGIQDIGINNHINKTARALIGGFDHVILSTAITGVSAVQLMNGRGSRATKD